MLTFPDYYKGEAKKRGVLNSTYRQVWLRHKDTKSENEMLISFKDKNSRGVTSS